jgi:hypothetical protein
VMQAPVRRSNSLTVPSPALCQHIDFSHTCVKDRGDKPDAVTTTLSFGDQAML